MNGSTCELRGKVTPVSPESGMETAAFEAVVGSQLVWTLYGQHVTQMRAVAMALRRDYILMVAQPSLR